MQRIGHDEPKTIWFAMCLLIVGFAKTSNWRAVGPTLAKISEKYGYRSEQSNRIGKI